jgi:DNA-binding LytR/AlgR family response regulator
MNVVIVEDERLSADRLQQMLTVNAPDLFVQAVLTSVNQATKWFGSHPLPDLIFMDIQLNDGLAFDILDRIKGEPAIIFTTAYDQYAVRAFKFKSIDYLLKPIDAEDLKNAVAKFTRHHHLSKSSTDSLATLFRAAYKQRFLIKIGDQYQPVDIQQIAYFLFDSGLSYIRVKDGRNLPLDLSLEAIQESVNPMDFFRVNRKYLVSLSAVKQIHSYFNSRLLLKLEPEWHEEVIVSRERVNEFKKWIGG